MYDNSRSFFVECVLADHVFYEFNGNRPDFNFKNKEEYWNYLIGLCDDFEMMRDCTNVHKHNRIRRPGRLLSSANQLHEVIVCTHYHDEKGKYIIAEKEIRVSLDNGEIKVFHKCLESVRNMWSNELFRLGIIDSLYPSNLSGAVYRQIHYAKIFISNEKTGCVYNVDVALTEEEKQQFDGLNSESEKNIFFKEIAESREISIESLESKFQQFS